MKYVKMIGLAALAAMALMAFAGAGTASASVLCKTAADPCPNEWDWPVGTEIEASIEEGTTATLRNTSSSIVNTCTGSNVKGKTTNTGSATETVDGKIEKANLTWSGCTNTTDTINGGIIEIHADEGVGAKPGDGTLTAKEIEVTVLIAGVTCNFNTGTGVDIGTYTEEKATFDITAVVNKTSTDSFLCPTTAVWEGTYKLTKPTTTVYVSKSRTPEP